MTSPLTVPAGSASAARRIIIIGAGGFGREVLRIEGEHVYRVPPLDVPSEHEEESEVLLGHSAVQLFIARATALSPEFSSHGENLRTIAAI